MEKVKNLKFKDLFSNDDDIMTNEENNREPSEPALELFLQRLNLARRHIDRLRDATGFRIMPENDPIRPKEASNTEEGVLEIVGEFFRQATKKSSYLN